MAKGKTLYTLAVNNFNPDILALTIPLMERWTATHGWRFQIIQERVWPEYPPAYEKLQVRNFARINDDEWSWFLDADALLHPDTPDLTEHLGKDVVAHCGSDPNLLRWRWDNYFRRDGRMIGSCNWCALASEWTRDDFWAPLDIPLEKALAQIHPIHGEAITGIITSEHLLDDFTMSRNIARYGLHFTTFQEEYNKLGMGNADFYWHTYNTTDPFKLVGIRQKLRDWLFIPVENVPRAHPHVWQDIPGWFLFADAYDELVSRQPEDRPSTIVEIGSWKGRSTAYLGIAAANSGKPITVVAIDTFTGSTEPLQQEDVDLPRLREVFEANMAPVRTALGERFRVIQADAVEAAAQFPDHSLNAVWLDAGHSYDEVCAQIHAWLPKLWQNGILGGDDYDMPPVARAVQDCLGATNHIRVLGNYTYWFAG